MKPLSRRLFLPAHPFSCAQLLSKHTSLDSRVIVRIAQVFSMSVIFAIHASLVFDFCQCITISTKTIFFNYLYFTASSGLRRAARRAGQRPVIKPTNGENPAIVSANHNGV